MTDFDSNPAAVDGLTAADVLLRVAGTVAIHLYEMEVLPDGSYVCHAFIGRGLERLLEEHLERALQRSKNERRALALLFVDLDNFKLINDSFGHTAGDELLRAVAERLRESTRAGDMVARQGGDEFLVLADSLDTRTAGGRDGLEVQDAAASVAAKLGRVLQ